MINHTQRLLKNSIAVKNAVEELTKAHNDSMEVINDVINGVKDDDKRKYLQQAFADAKSGKLDIKSFEREVRKWQ